MFRISTIQREMLLLLLLYSAGHLGCCKVINQPMHAYYK